VTHGGKRASFAPLVAVMPNSSVGSGVRFGFRPEEVVAAAYESARPMGLYRRLLRAARFVPHGTVGFGLLARVMASKVA